MTKLFPGTTCTTVSGPAPNKPCKFPFEYKNKSYYECIEDDRNQPWCMTGTPGKWGYCGSSCKDHSAGISFTF